MEWMSTLALQTVPGAFLNSFLAPLVATYLVRRVTSPGNAEERFQW